MGDTGYGVAGAGRRVLAATFGSMLALVGGEVSAAELAAPGYESALLAAAKRVNDEERKQRVEYYEYLKGKGDAEPTLEEHLARFGSFARFGQPAGDSTVEALRARSQVPLPEDLVRFYRTSGSFQGGHYLKNMVVHAPDTLVKKSRRDPERPWDYAASMGLVDMIRWSWANDRFEFDPKSREGLTEDEVVALNRRYSIVGWYVIEEGEGHEYLYFDDKGRFGTLYYHQDAFDELYREDLKPMLGGREAPDTFDAAMLRLLKGAESPDFE